MLSVNTNKGAMIALQNLNATNRGLEETQNRINTGLKVSSAKDNSSIYAIAQGMRGDVKALNAVKQSLDRVVSIVDVAMAAGEAISDLIVEMKEKAVAANDPSLDTAARNALNEDFQSLVDQVGTIISNAKFDGANLLNGSNTTGIAVLADAEASNTITIQDENLSLGGSIITFNASNSLSSQGAASTALSAINASLTNVNAALARMGSSANQLETHQVFVGKLQDSLEAGVGNLVDADLATESARLQALQVKQQLGTQALSIANQSPQVILSLFQ